MAGNVVLGAIDAGSNALRAVVARLDDRGETSQIAALREPVRLGHGAFTVGELASETIENAIEAFRTFRALFDEYGVRNYRAVATSALRSSRNRDIVLHRAWAEAGINLEVISGKEEARLILKAVRNVYRNRPSPTTILDLGGGSLEVNVRNVAAWKAVSLPIGTVRLMETLGLTGAIAADEAAMVRRHVTSLLHTFLPEPGRDFAPAVACGGNAERFAKLLGGDPQTHIEAADLEAALPGILAADVPSRMRTLGVRRDRAEVMGVAGLVLASVARELRLERLEVPHVGIRDALLLELAETLPEGKEAAADARRKAILGAAQVFAARVGHDTTHGDHVRQLASSLFDQLQFAHGLGAGARNRLEVASVLHDVGEVLHGRSHHKHGEYMVTAGRIPGLTSPDREIVATLVRCHRKSLPNAKKHPAYAALNEAQQAETRKLLAILRLADAMDTDHRQTITEVTVKNRNGNVELRIKTRGPAVDPATVLRKAQLFESELGYALSVAAV